MNDGLIEAFSTETALWKPFLDRIARLYADMDDRYRQVSDQYGFHCQGCKDNCCCSTFYHHTVLESLYLMKGFEQMDKERQAVVVERAQTVSLQPRAGHFCPLCQEEKCLLYAYRPMICRLHGIAHEVRRPGGAVSYGPGCAQFENVTKGQSYIVFDRTEVYWALSRLEKEAREVLGVTQKIKMTVSQMVTVFESRSHS